MKKYAALTLMAFFLGLTSVAQAEYDKRDVLMTQESLTLHCKRQIETSILANDLFHSVLTLYVKNISDGLKKAGTQSCCGVENWDIKVSGMEEYDMDALTEIAEDDFQAAMEEMHYSGAFDDYLKNFDLYKFGEWGISRGNQVSTEFVDKGFKAFTEGDDETMTMDFTWAYSVKLLPGKSGSKGGVLKIKSDAIKKASGITYATPKEDPLWLDKPESLYLVPFDFSCARKLQSYAF